MDSQSPQRLREKKGTHIKLPNDSPTISPSQLKKQNTFDVPESNKLEIRMIQVQNNKNENQLIMEEVEQDWNYMGQIPQKIVQKQQQQNNSKVDQKNDSISPGKQMSQSQLHTPYLEILTINFKHEISFLTIPIELFGTIQCLLQINKSGLNIFRPKIYLIKDDQCFLAAKKVGQKYLISLDKENIDRSSPNFIGQISCKKNKTYKFYDTGLNPKRKKEPYRNCLGDLTFYNPPKPTEPRKQSFRFWNNEVEYYNKQPQWDQKKEKYTLNFYQRVNISSIKNFQLIKKDESPEQVYVLMGKQEKHKFNLDFTQPFSPLIAFMIGICNYDQKLQI